MDWDKRKSQMSMSAPRKCSCGGKLTKIAYEKKQLKIGNRLIEYGEGRFRKRCVKCVLYYEWSYPNVWMERSELPLYDSRDVLEQKCDFYGNLKRIK